MKTLECLRWKDLGRSLVPFAAAKLAFALTLIVGLLFTGTASGQLFTNLQSLGTRLDVGDPSIPATYSIEGPKGIATGDLDNDGRPDLAVANNDGTVTVFFGIGQGHFTPPMHLQTGEQELRGIVCADFNGDNRCDLAVAAPYNGEIFLFLNLGGRSFGNAMAIWTWLGARNLAAGDFDGDGRTDIAVAGTTIGLQQLRGNNTAQFDIITNLLELASDNPDFPKPVYSLAVFRPEGESRDELAVTHADSDLIWIIGAGSNGVMSIQGTLTNQELHAIDVGALTQPASSNQLDLATVSRELGTIEIHRGIAGPARFEQAITQRIEVPGGPRAVEIVDLDGDGWNDLVVVLRNFDRVLSYHNSNGVLIASSEQPVGKSPREVVSGDFNGDGRPDVAVMNNDSSDVSVLLTHPGQTGFSALDQIYPVDGQVSGLMVLDINGDGYDDVMQLHRASAEFSIRLAGTNGLLGEPKFYPMGSGPSAQSAVDVNNDGYPDVVTANLGGIERGSVSVRLGDAAGNFGPEQRFYLPESANGSLFALVAADFDNDGNIDLAAGFFDCRLAFFQGHGDGSFTFTHAHRFVYESRVMVVGDFDQDGDIDIAGAGYAGDVVVIENTGDLLATTTLTRHDYPTPSQDKFGTRDIVAADVNGDGDLDLIVGSGNGTMLFYGLEGIAFLRASVKLPGTDFPASAVAVGDFDGDGSRDVAVSCRILSCVSILTRGTNGQYQPTISVDVPSGEFLASGDLDGDGKADLVGSGSVLWTALSSRRPQPVAASPIVEAHRENVIGAPVINEIMAINTRFPVEQDGGRTSDWIELYNGAATAFPLNGWKLRLVQGSGTSATTNDFALPPTAFLASKARLLIFFSETRRTTYHTGFRLPGGGGVLSLINAAGTVIDRVVYPAQEENVAYARYRDGLPAFASNPIPSPGRPNTDNGPVDPVVSLGEANLPGIQPDQAIHFDIIGRDDVGIVSMVLSWKRLDVLDNEVHRLVLYDDGEHGDGAMLDGHFGATLYDGLPEGGEIQFYIEAVDLSGQTVVLPSEPVFSQNGQPVTLYSLAVGAQRPSIEISEVVASNTTGLQDELGERPDWVEIRNCSASPVPLNNIALSPRFYSTSSRYLFGSGDSLAPGEHRLVYCDNKPARSPRHAPFVLNRQGDQVFLTGIAPGGARFLIDSINFGIQENDIALARLGCGGTWWSNTPTPASANVAGSWLGIVSADRTQFTFVFPTATNHTYTVQYATALNGPQWTSWPAIQGDGIEHVVTQPLVDQRFYRVRQD